MYVFELFEEKHQYFYNALWVIVGNSQVAFTIKASQIALQEERQWEWVVLESFVDLRDYCNLIDIKAICLESLNSTQCLNLFSRREIFVQENVMRVFIVLCSY